MLQIRRLSAFQELNVMKGYANSNMGGFLSYIENRILTKWYYKLFLVAYQIIPVTQQTYRLLVQIYT